MTRPDFLLATAAATATAGAGDAITGAGDAADAPRRDARDGSCHLCGDEAVVGCVLAIDSAAHTATVAFGASMATVALDLVDAGVGDYVLVHLGFAIERVTP